MKPPFEAFPGGQSDSSGGFDDDALLARLARELKPEPIAPELVNRIRADWDLRMAAHVRRRSRAWLSGSLAAAACALAMLFPPQRSDRGAAGASSLALSTDDADELLAAVSLTGWQSHVESALSLLERQVARIDRSLTGDSSETFLPWSGDENWDLPADSQSDVRSG